MRRTGFHSIKMVDWTKQTGDKDLGRGIDASATGKLGKKSIGVQQDRYRGHLRCIGWPLP